MFRIFQIVIVLGMVLKTILAQEAPFTIGGDSSIVADDFRITSFADSLNFPVGMILLDDNSVLVAVTNDGPFFGSSSGSFVQLQDLDNDGIADIKNVLVDDVPIGRLSALDRQGNIIVTTGQAENILIYHFNNETNKDFKNIGIITLSDQSWFHPNSTILLRKTPDIHNSYDVFIPLGSNSNFEQTTETAWLSSNFGISGVLAADAIHKISFIIDGDSIISGTNPVQIASGLRNPAGLAVHPQTGDLYFQDNGIDGVVDANEPTSADEINYIPFAAIGGEVENFGFPDSYIEYRTNEFVGSQGISPLVGFQPWPDMQSGSESEGPNEIAFAPPDFPADLNKGLFVGFHGKWALGGLSNEENPFLYANTENGEYFHFIDNDQNVGHLDGILAADNKLYISDIAPGGGFDNRNDFTGKIYLVEYIGKVSGLKNSDRILNNSFTLSDAFPNPFNLETNINFRIEIPGNVSVSIFNITGKKIKNLVNNFYQAGNYTLKWNAQDNKNNIVESGAYFLRMKYKNHQTVKRILLIK